MEDPLGHNRTCNGNTLPFYILILFTENKLKEYSLFSYYLSFVKANWLERN